MFFGDVESLEEARQLGVNPPSELEVRRAIEIGCDALSDSNNRLLVHCTMGMSRSPAIAIAILTRLLGEGSEGDSVQLVERARGKVIPNGMVIELADKLLERGGQLVAATSPANGGEAIEILAPVNEN